VQTLPVVILTREPEDNKLLADRLKDMDIDVIQYPCIRTALLPYGRDAHLPQGIELEDFQTVVFTSKRGVAGMTDAYERLAASKQRIAVVGNTTAERIEKAVGRKPDLIAYPSTSEGLASQLVCMLSTTDRVLHVRGSKSTGSFKRIMEGHGFNVTELVVYRNDSPEKEPLDPVEKAIVLFASPSAARCFFEANNDPAVTGKWSYLAIGPTTAGFLRKNGITRLFEAREPGIDSLVEKIREIIALDKTH
jgi:uroporphyrinogen-III synthase